jgi:hypothetical protein
MARPSPPLYNAVRRGQCQLRDTVPPTFVRLTRRALEEGTAEPSKRNKYVFYGYTGLRRDVRLAGTVLSVTIRPVRPSPPLQHHARHCDNIPDVVGAHGDRTSPRSPLYLIRSPVDSTLESVHGRRPDDQPLSCYPRSRSCTSTGLATTPQRERDSSGQPSTPRHCSPYLYTLAK